MENGDEFEREQGELYVGGFEGEERHQGNDVIILQAQKLNNNF